MLYGTGVWIVSYYGDWVKRAWVFYFGQSWLLFSMQLLFFNFKRCRILQGWISKNYLVTVNLFNKVASVWCILLPGRMGINFFHMIHSKIGTASCLQSGGGPLRLKRKMVCIVSFLQQGHCKGLYNSRCGFIVARSAGSWSLITTALPALEVLLSIP